jgi:tetratricopeptide (TPR) repeat protein
MRLQDAKDAETGTRIATAIERLWVYSGSDTADLLLGRAATAIEGRQADVAREVLDALIGLEPRYAEAWNRRAYLNYSEQNYAGALSDLSHVLALEPRHFKALEGLGSILKEIGQKRLALKAYRKVLELYPMADEARAAAEALAREVEGQKI